jgi:hypothetical protein
MFDILRAVFAVIGAVLVFRAGHLMRAQGSGVDFSFGLLAYGAGFALLAYAAAGLGAVAGVSARRTGDGRSQQGDDHRG